MKPTVARKNTATKILLKVHKAAQLKILKVCLTKVSTLKYTCTNYSLEL